MLDESATWVIPYGHKYVPHVPTGGAKNQMSKNGKQKRKAESLYIKYTPKQLPQKAYTNVNMTKGEGINSNRRK